MGGRGSWSSNKEAVEQYHRRYRPNIGPEENANPLQSDEKNNSLTRDPLLFKINHKALTSLICNIPAGEMASIEEIDGQYADCYWFLLKIALIIIGASQAELCDLIGRHKSYIPTLAKNKIRPSDELEQRIYELTGCAFLKPGMAPYIFKEIVVNQRYDCLARFSPEITDTINAAMLLDNDRIIKLRNHALSLLQEKQLEDQGKTPENNPFR